MLKSREQVGPDYKPITSAEYLDYDEVIRKYDQDDGLAG